MTTPPPIKIRLLPTLAVIGVGAGMFAWAMHYRGSLDAAAALTPDQQWHMVYLAGLMVVAALVVAAVAGVALYAAIRNAGRMSADEVELAESLRKLEQSRRELEIKRMAQRNIAATAGHHEEIARIDAEIAAANRAKHDQWMRQ